MSPPLSDEVRSFPVAGRLKFFISFWENLTENKFILRIIRGITIPFTELPRQNYLPMPIRCSELERVAITHEVEKYLEKGIINEVSHCKNEFISQIFPRPKRSGGLRIILNLSKLNLSVKYEHFKMETINSVLMLIKPNCYGVH